MCRQCTIDNHIDTQPLTNVLVGDFICLLVWHVIPLPWTNRLLITPAYVWCNGAYLLALIALIGVTELVLPRCRPLNRAAKAKPNNIFQNRKSLRGLVLHFMVPLNLILRVSRQSYLIWAATLLIPSVGRNIRHKAMWNWLPVPPKLHFGILTTFFLSAILVVIKCTHTWPVRQLVGCLPLQLHFTRLPVSNLAMNIRALPGLDTTIWLALANVHLRPVCRAAAYLVGAGS